MADRHVTRSTDPNIGGGPYMDLVADKFTILFNNMTLIPTAITNTGNDYTITLDPTLDADVTAGMGFYITPNAINTGACRIRATTLNPYYDLVKASGAALAGGDFDPANVYFCVFVGGKFKILSVSASAGGTFAAVYFQEFLTSGTWTKPTGISTDAMVFVECWGGGGGGARFTGPTTSNGGSGGQYRAWWFRASDLAATVTVTVGSGGAGATTNGSGSDGGITSFGTLITANPGIRGTTGAGAMANGGGYGPTTITSGDWGMGGQGSTSANQINPPNLSVNSIFGGGGGGSGTATGVTCTGVPGTSVFAGAGGGTGGANGSTPAGGGAGCNGGNGGTGGAGKVRVRVVG